MQKTMYSLILSDEIVQAIDSIARKKGTNRSNLINQVLAEYVSLTTPEKRVRNIFDVVENYISQKQNTLLCSQANDMTMKIKSSLQYHYRPTVHYEVEMYRTPTQTIGQLKIQCRTTSAQLLQNLTQFFELWIQLEHLYIHQFFPKDAIQYSIENNYFLRTFAVPNNFSYTEEQIGNAISQYIAVFDDLLKNYLYGTFDSADQIEERYLQYINSNVQLI